MFDSSDFCSSHTKFIFVFGGVASGIGKGIASAVSAALLQCCDFKVKIRKLDPYLNLDPGTMNPLQHGEVFVTGDGLETDMDLGHYERFTGIPSNSDDNVTSGKIYATLLQNERSGQYLGATVQIVPHLTSLIKEFITKNTFEYDFVLCEIGGTVGDCEALPFLETVRELQQDIGKHRTMCLFVSPLPRLFQSELKTKPTQHAVRFLRSCGISPDVLLCRHDGQSLDEDIVKKIAFTCGLQKLQVIPAGNVKNIYLLPMIYNNAGLTKAILSHFNLSQVRPNLKRWMELQLLDMQPKAQSLNIAIVGKYIGMPDAYCSLIEAVKHAALKILIDLNIEIIEATDLELSDEDFTVEKKLLKFSGIIIAGGFGNRGIAGKIAAIRWARENNVPTFGICLGAQLIAIEFAENVIGIRGATSREFSDGENNIVIALKDCDGISLKNWPFVIKVGDESFPIRLGNYSCEIQEKTLAHQIYQTQLTVERHRHRYEINPQYKEILEKHGLLVSGKSKETGLAEIIELNTHPWAIGVQFHPELKSNPLDPHPLFVAFLNASLANKEKISGAISKK